MSVEDTARAFSLYDPETMRDPHAVYDELRSRCPVAHSEQDEGFYIATRYKDIHEVTLAPETFSSKYVMIPRLKFGPDFVERPPLTLDPPRHTHFRKLLLPGFTQAQAAKWEPTIRNVVKQYLDPLIGAGRCDAASQFAKKIPLGFTCELMGVPAEMEDTFTQWSKDLVESTEMDAVMRSVGGIVQFLGEQVAARAENPTDDLISILMNSEVDGQRLEGQDLLGTLMVVMIAGLDTTWAALSSCMLHLASHPEDRRRLVAEPDLIPTAVEELLRFYAPVALTRETTREVELNGTTLPAESLILLAWNAANRDPEVFPDADKVVIDRKENRHVAFGTGIHRCIGAAIARMEIKVALEEWLRAIPEFELEDPDAVTYATGHVWGPRTVPVVYPTA